MYSGSSRSTWEESMRIPGRPVTWSACVWEMKMLVIFFHRRFRRRRPICVPSPQSKRNSSPSLRTRTEVNPLPGRGIMPPVPSTNASRFIRCSILLGEIDDPAAELGHFHRGVRHCLAVGNDGRETSFETFLKRGGRLAHCAPVRREEAVPARLPRSVGDAVKPALQADEASLSRVNAPVFATDCANDRLFNLRLGKLAFLHELQTVPKSVERVGNVRIPVGTEQEKTVRVARIREGPVCAALHAHLFPEIPR